MELRDADQLIARYGPPAGFAERYAINRVLLGPDYIEYVFAVSGGHHAMSLPLASFLLTICELGQPGSAADLGSGFSSFVLRRYAAARPGGAGTRIVSADDDPDWLARTSRFIGSKGLPVDDLVPWRDVAAMDERFELVLYDLGHWQLRFDALPHALAAVAPGGLLVLDDLHVDRYRELVEGIVGAAGLQAYDLTPYTADEFGRFAWAVVT